jgi:hypothetical protein
MTNMASRILFANPRAHLSIIGMKRFDKYALTSVLWCNYIQGVQRLQDVLDCESRSQQDGKPQMAPKPRKNYLIKI